MKDTLDTALPAHITGLLVDGAWQDPPGWLDIISPAEGRPYGRIAACGEAEVDRAVASARAALDGDWGRMAAAERGRLLAKAGLMVRDRAEDLARLDTVP